MSIARTLCEKFEEQKLTRNVTTYLLDDYY